MGFINFLWLLIFGWWQALVWLLLSAVFAVTVVGLPIAKSCLQFAKLSAFPFGKEIISETELKGKDNVSGIRKIGGTIINVIWFPIGLILAIFYVIIALASCVTIFGIPAGIVYFRMGKFLLFPIGAKVVSKKQAYASAVANELEKRKDNN